VARKGLALDARELLRGCGLTAWRFDHLITAQASFQPYHCVVADSPYLDISRGYEAYLAQQREKGSHTIPKTLQKARKMARELAAPLRFEPHTTDRRVLAKLIDWKQQQYAELKDVNYLAPRWTKMLLESVVDMRDEAFSGMMSALYVGERLAAIHLGIRSYDVLHAWFPTYDPALANYSPGLVLWVELLQACPALHIGRIDLGKGQQRFKTSLMSAAEPVAEGTVDLRRMQASFRRTWLHARDWIRATPLRAPARVPARMLRRFQAWLATH
jgi:CelD/BcsL family acetyltransferase involved in cellulose biosynthesis